MRRLSSLWMVVGLGWFVIEPAGCGGKAGTAPDNTVAGTGSKARGGSGGGLVTGKGGSIVVVGTGGSGGGPDACLGPNPPASCNLVAPPGCGDGENNQDFEVCDDGNTVPGDGCNGACLVEPNWTCPPAGECSPIILCGDGKVGPGEVCDDANRVDGDGCSADCTSQDAAYRCVPGVACTRISVCGDGRVGPGESCDDGNATPSDGCSGTCQTETGWVCRTPGSACTRAARCGDGTVNSGIGEVCDDGNTAEGDGCSGDCKKKGAGCVCTPGQLCQCPVPVCGNGKLEAQEACDDKNTRSGDGCSSTCSLEPGYECPFAGAPCVTDCGDGIVTAPAEECDPGVNVPNMDQACTTSCQWAPGWVCVGTPPTSCRATVCGDGKPEGTESCDDGNSDMGDGCGALCQVEPRCPATGGPCTSGCGDGLLVPQLPSGTRLGPGDNCDDGNSLNGDGCSSSCTVEDGFECSQPPLENKMYVPMVVRDFKRGGDFEPGSAIGQYPAVTGLVQGTLDAKGKPALAGVGRGNIVSAATFAQWYVDTPLINSTYKTQMVLYDNGQGSYVNRYGPNGEQWLVLTRPTEHFCGEVGREDHDAAGNPIPCTFCPYDADPTTPQCEVPQATDCQVPPAPLQLPLYQCLVNGNQYNGVFVLAKLDGNPLFFPLDGVPGMITPVGEYATAQIPRPYNDSWLPDPSGALHNFHFTSEVRYWFTYNAGTPYVLDFTGDDDVWVFINKRLAVDLGGIHTPVNGNLRIDATGAGTVTVTQTEPVPVPAPTTQTVSLGLENGQVYEIAVFQAERKVTASTYRLTLSGFNAAATKCRPICGNGVVTAGEQCDNGADNTGGYNKCTPDCRLGPFCGDGNVDAPDEQCDNITNDDQYGASGGCAPGCKLPARCGDGLVQIEWGEECDDGENAGAYGGCKSNCTRAGYCGNALPEGPEACDDGKNDGTYGTCGDPTQDLPNCGLPPRCGDGVVQEAWGEQCEPTSATDTACTQACRLPGSCGDGIMQTGEECDYGTEKNTGEYGGCAPGCVRAPRCGDGVKNGPEECDDGTNDGSYGGCTPQCRLAGHCGDGVRNGPEKCDDGELNGTAESLCTKQCTLLEARTT